MQVQLHQNDIEWILCSKADYVVVEGEVCDIALVTCMLDVRDLSENTGKCIEHNSSCCIALHHVSSCSKDQQCRKSLSGTLELPRDVFEPQELPHDVCEP